MTKLEKLTILISMTALREIVDISNRSMPDPARDIALAAIREIEGENP